ncbi:MAG: hypothetical protein R3C18_08270 [Planctomycetaceae bacterium]
MFTNQNDQCFTADWINAIKGFLTATTAVILMTCLVGCDSSSPVGTWVQVHEYGANISQRELIIYANGQFEMNSNTEVARDNPFGFDVTSEISGTWQMLGDNRLQLQGTSIAYGSAGVTTGGYSRVMSMADDGQAIFDNASAPPFYRQ